VPLHRPKEKKKKINIKSEKKEKKNKIVSVQSIP